MDEFNLYLSGLSIPEVSEKTGIPKSTLRNRFLKAGILRTRSEGVKNAAKRGLLGSGLRGKKRVFTDEWRENISRGKLLQGKIQSVGVRVTSNGYIEATRGEHKGRLIHNVVMEQRIGRPLFYDECVHHINRDKKDNSIDNLALMTRSAHAKLHKFEDDLEGKQTERDKYGKFK